MSHLNLTTAHQLAQMIRDRAVSSTEVLEAHFAQIAKYNSQLHAICTLDEENARIRAKQADEVLAKGEVWGPLHGVPITIKDIFETAGLRTTAGYIPLKDYIPQEDATVVAKLKAAGAILLGKTNLAELAVNLSEILNLYTRLAAYINIYAQPIDRYNLRRSFQQIFRTATQGEKSLRQLGDFSRVLPELLNPGLKGYFAALTERDRFIAQLEMALENWDVWLTPVAATPAFTHRPAWSAVEVDGRSYPHAVANGAYTMPFNLSGHPAIVIPIGQTPAGLPIGLQMVGKRWKEMELLEMARQIDQVVGQFQHPLGYRD